MRRTTVMKGSRDCFACLIGHRVATWISVPVPRTREYSVPRTREYSVPRTREYSLPNPDDFFPGSVEQAIACGSGSCSSLMAFALWRPAERACDFDSFCSTFVRAKCIPRLSTSRLVSTLDQIHLMELCQHLQNGSFEHSRCVDFADHLRPDLTTQDKRCRGCHLSARRCFIAIPSGPVGDHVAAWMQSPTETWFAEGLSPAPLFNGRRSQRWPVTCFVWKRRLTEPRPPMKELTNDTTRPRHRTQSRKQYF